VSNNRIVFEGLDELRAALRQLPSDLAGEASNIVVGIANAAALNMRTLYGDHRVSGELQEKVVVERLEVGKVAAGMVVKSASKLAGIFENGTQARHTALGANRGSMPPGHVVIPTAIAARRRMYEQLKDMLVRHGLEVSGDA
jgi:hypothetical protein